MARPKGVDHDPDRLKKEAVVIEQYRDSILQQLYEGVEPSQIARVLTAKSNTYIRSEPIYNIKKEHKIRYDGK